jgi:hypothetical protein
MNHPPAHLSGRGISRRPTTAALVGATALLLAALASGDAAAARDHASYHGVFTETATGAALGYDLHGSVKMTIGPDGTGVAVSVAGLDPAKVYGSHLHDGTCASGGGGHYQDVEGGAAAPPNELWLTTSGTVLEPNPGGVARGSGSATWRARTSGDTTLARSVVVHEPGGARIACADLT